MLPPQRRGESTIFPRKSPYRAISPHAESAFDCFSLIQKFYNIFRKMSSFCACFAKFSSGFRKWKIFCIFSLENSLYNEDTSRICAESEDDSMNVQAISTSSIVLFLPEAELSVQGIAPEALDTCTAVAFARQAFCQLGVSPGGMIDVEAYVNRQGVMVFASLRGPWCDVYELYRFRDLETMIAAIHALSGDPPATLLTYREEYFLAFHNCCQRLPLEVLQEYGEPEPHPELRYLYLQEHGKTLCAGDAAALLRSTFPARA